MQSSLAIRSSDLSEVRQALAAISEKHGHLSPELLVKESKNKNHPCHESIWGKTGEEAEYQYRLIVARLLIRSVKLDIVRLDEKKREISFETSRAYVSPPSIRGSQSYVKLSDAMGDESLRSEMLERAKRELKALKERYRQLDELSRVWDAVELI
jgi:hypothetical protein